MVVVKELFAQKGIKATVQRLLVYKALEALGHATVEQVVDQVHRRVPTVAVATIYNVLEMLATQGVIARLCTDDNRRYYDITPSVHHHILCDQRIVDVKDERLTQLIMDHLRDHPVAGFCASSIRLQILGTFKN